MPLVPIPPVSDAELGDHDFVYKRLKLNMEPVGSDVRILAVVAAGDLDFVFVRGRILLFVKIRQVLL